MAAAAVPPAAPAEGAAASAGAPAGQGGDAGAPAAAPAAAPLRAAAARVGTRLAAAPRLQVRVRVVAEAVCPVPAAGSEAEVLVRLQAAAVGEDGPLPLSALFSRVTATPADSPAPQGWCWALHRRPPAGDAAVLRLPSALLPRRLHLALEPLREVDGVPQYSLALRGTALAAELSTDYGLSAAAGGASSLGRVLGAITAYARARGAVKGAALELGPALSAELGTSSVQITELPAAVARLLRPPPPVTLALALPPPGGEPERAAREAGPFAATDPGREQLQQWLGALAKGAAQPAPRPQPPAKRARLAPQGGRAAGWR
eukprot:TRINITY_DN27653_c0_g1_i1.p1 TRINITY_DN27653_c0_g1~~TRINITY_DN27653_c0_g1_i1.p1  ORF type:complete len:318 (+),score=74.61 TRINITY_DN27653_c0_g1_i1:74-1027(+)